MTLLVQRTVEERESTCDIAVERIGTAPGICIDCLAPGPAEAESGRQAAVAPSAVESTHSLGPDNVNCRAGRPARNKYSPVSRWPKLY
jgi:hypothetical protein